MTLFLLLIIQQLGRTTGNPWYRPLGEITRDVHDQERTSAHGARTSSEVPFDPFFTNGVQQVWREGQLQFEAAFGYQSRTYDVAMPMNNNFRVGSNTKLFTAVSIYQLHEKGLLNVSDNVSSYLDAGDFEAFGFPNQTEWCPQLYDGNGECQPITFVQLMSMSSGMVDGINCNYPPGSWELEYCQDFTANQVYIGSIAAIVGNFINWPLSSAAGESFHYTNENFILLSYIIEKLSGTSFGVYLKENVIDIAGLKSTYYSPWEGSVGPYDTMLGEEYRDYHDLSVNTDIESSYYASSICSDEFNTGAFCGTGGMVSNAYDMYTWYNNLFVDYNPQILTKASIDRLISPIQLTGCDPDGSSCSYFGQGVGVDVYNGSDTPYVIYYTGGMYCATTSIRMLTATSTEPAVIAIAFRNNVIVNATKQSLNEAMRSVTGTFYDIAYTMFGWETYGETRVIVEELADYFRENPTDSLSNDDDSNSLGKGAVVGIVLAACGLAVVGVGGLYLWSSQRSKKGADGGLTGDLLGQDSSNLN